DDVALRGGHGGRPAHRQLGAGDRVDGADYTSIVSRDRIEDGAGGGVRAGVDRGVARGRISSTHLVDKAATRDDLHPTCAYRPQPVQTTVGTTRTYPAQGALARPGLPHAGRGVQPAVRASARQRGQELRGHRATPVRGGGGTPAAGVQTP